jgi:hypothetical protein
VRRGRAAGFGCPESAIDPAPGAQAGLPAQVQRREPPRTAARPGGRQRRTRSGKRRPTDGRRAGAMSSSRCPGGGGWRHLRVGWPLWPSRIGSWRSQCWSPSWESLPQGAADPLCAPVATSPRARKGLTSGTGGSTAARPVPGTCIGPCGPLPNALGRRSGGPSHREEGTGARAGAMARLARLAGGRGAVSRGGCGSEGQCASHLWGAPAGGMTPAGPSGPGRSWSGHQAAGRPEGAEERSGGASQPPRRRECGLTAPAVSVRRPGRRRCQSVGWKAGAARGTASPGTSRQVTGTEAAVLGVELAGVAAAKERSAGASHLARGRKKRRDQPPLGATQAAEVAVRSRATRAGGGRRSGTSGEGDWHGQPPQSPSGLGSPVRRTPGGPGQFPATVARGGEERGGRGPRP